MDIQFSSLVGYFKKANAYLVFSIRFNETVHDKWCLHKSVGETDNGLERVFDKHWLNSGFKITGPLFPFSIFDFRCGQNLRIRFQVCYIQEVKELTYLGLLNPLFYSTITRS